MQKLINELFALCVNILKVGATKFHITYEAINIYIFCVVGPIIFSVMIFMLIRQYIKIIKLTTTTKTIQNESN